MNDAEPNGWKRVFNSQVEGRFWSRTSDRQLAMLLLWISVTEKSGKIIEKNPPKIWSIEGSKLVQVSDTWIKRNG